MGITVNARWIAAGLLIGLWSHDAAAQASNPNVLWQIVHGQCVPDQQQHRDRSRAPKSIWPAASQY
jgi:CDP-diacylglycerol pyrophosphatase